MLITGSARLSGAVQTPQITAPVFMFGRYPQMDNDAGPGAINLGSDGSGGIVVNGSTIAITRGYNARDVEFGATTTNLNTRSRPGTGWTYAVDTYLSFNALDTAVDPYGMTGSCLTNYYYPYESTWAAQSPGFSVTDGVVYELIFIAKANESGWAAIYGYLVGGGSWVNLSTGAAGTALGNATDVSVTSLGDSWYEVRMYITATATTAGTSKLEVYPGVADNDNVYSETNNPSIARFYVSHTQISAGAYAHPIVVSSGSAGTLTGINIPDVSGGVDSAARWSTTGTPVYNRPGPGPSIVGVQTDGTSYFKANSGPTIGTKDMIAAIAMKWRYHTSDQVHCGTRLGAAGLDGWQVYTEGTTYTPRMYIYDGSDGVTVQAPTLVDGQDVLLVFCLNRGENSTSGAYAFANSIAGSGVNPYAVVDSITDDSPFTLFALGDGTADSLSGTVIYGAWVWQAADIFSAGATGAAEMQAVASELTQRYFGVYPQLAEDGDYTMTITQATKDAVFVDRGGVKSLFYYPGGTLVNDGDGVLIQAAATNIARYSYDLNNWGKYQATAALNYTGIDGLANSATTVTEDGTTNYHYFGANLISDLAADWYEVSCIIKSANTGANRNCVRFQIYNAADSSKYGGYFYDYVNGTVGSVNAANWTVADPEVEDLGGGWFRLSHFVLATAEAGVVQFLLAQDDETISYAGNSSAVCYVQNVDVQRGKWRHSPIRVPSTSSITRDAMLLDVDPDNIPQGDFTVVFELKLPVLTSSVEYGAPIDICSGDNAQRVVIGHALTTGIPYVYTAGGGSASGPIALTAAGGSYDGAWHRYVVALKNGAKTFLKVDSDSVTDAHGLTVGTRTEMLIGRDFTDSNFLNGRLRNLVIYDGYYEGA